MEPWETRVPCNREFGIPVGGGARARSLLLSPRPFSRCCRDAPRLLRPPRHPPHPFGPRPMPRRTPDSGTTVGSLRQSYIGFLNAFRDPADQTPASPPPNPPAAAGRVGPAAASGPATVAAAPPPDAQSFRPVPPITTRRLPRPISLPDQPSAAAPPGATTAAAPSAPPANPPPAADRPYALEFIPEHIPISPARGNN